MLLNNGFWLRLGKPIGVFKDRANSIRQIHTMMLFDFWWISKVDLMENNCRIYLITPDSLDPVTFAAPLTQALDRDGPVCSLRH